MHCVGGFYGKCALASGKYRVAHIFFDIFRKILPKLFVKSEISTTFALANGKEQGSDLNATGIWEFFS